MFNILMSSGGGTVRHFMEGLLTFEEAQQICESYGWAFMEEAGGFVWDLEIVEG